MGGNLTPFIKGLIFFLWDSLTPLLTIYFNLKYNGPPLQEVVNVVSSLLVV